MAEPCLREVQRQRRPPSGHRGRRPKCPDRHHHALLARDPRRHRLGRGIVRADIDIQGIELGSRGLVLALECAQLSRRHVPIPVLSVSTACRNGNGNDIAVTRHPTARSCLPTRMPCTIAHEM